MKCYLHIGTEKTATTTIQDFLNLNRSKLLKNNIIYTTVTGKSNNRRLPVVAYNSWRRDDYTKSILIQSDEALLQYQENILFELQKEIEEIKSQNKMKNPHVLFSSEHLQSRLTTIVEIQNLKNSLESIGMTEFYIVVYLRDPAATANSLFSTEIKYGGVKKYPDPPSNPYYGNICNHKKTLMKFESVFGKSSIIPRIFHKSKFKNNSIFEDFSNAIGIKSINSFKFPEKKNESLSTIGINLLRHINKLIPLFIDDMQNPLRKNIFSYFEKHYSDSKYVMPSDLYEKYTNAFKGSNQWVLENYFPNEKELFPVSERKRKTGLTILESDIEKMAQLIANIWIDKQTRIEKLK